MQALNQKQAIVRVYYFLIRKFLHLQQTKLFINVRIFYFLSNTRSRPTKTLLKIAAHLQQSHTIFKFCPIDISLLMQISCYSGSASVLVA